MGRRRPEEYELNEVEDTITGSVGSRMRLVSSELGLRKTASTLCARGGFVIDPRSRLVLDRYLLFLLYTFMQYSSAIFINVTVPSMELELVS